MIPVVLLLLFLSWTPPLPLGAVVPDNYVWNPINTWAFAGRLAIAAWIYPKDKWLGLAVAYVSTWALIAGHEPGRTTALMFTLGAGSYILLRGRTPAWTRHALVGTAIAFTLISLYAPDFSFGNRRYLGAYIAAVTPLAPPLVLPVLGLGLIQSQSWLALIAATVGVLLVYRHRVWRLAPAFAIAFAVVLYARGTSAETLWTRVDVWKTGLAQMDGSWLRVLFGRGPAGWSAWVPLSQDFGNPSGWFIQAHNEYLQWFYETGLVGLVLLALWCAHLHIRQDWRGSVAAIAILCAGLHVFHWASLAPVLVLMMGAAQEGDTPC